MSTNDPREPEYVGSGPGTAPTDPTIAGSGAGSGAGSRAGRGGRRTGVVAAAAVAVVAAVGAGAYGVSQFMSGGDSAASAVPADAVAYLSLDLDPSAAQKIEAIKIFRKFPALRSQLDISSRDDLRRTLFEQIQKDGTCKGLDYDRDVEPWLGSRVAVAAVPEGAKVVPLAVLQVSDEDKARAGVRKLDDCDRGSGSASGKPTGVAFSGDYMLVAQTADEAARFAKAADSATLADDADYKTWMGRVGDPGIVTMYAAKGAPQAMLRAAEGVSKTGPGSSGLGSSGLGSSRQLQQAFKDFKGAAGVVRFKDGAVEAEFGSQGLGQGMAATTPSGPDVRTLPASTGAAISVSLQAGWLDRYLDMLRTSLGSGSLDDAMRQGEQATGLQLPQDIETLLGSGFDVSVDAKADLAELRRSPDPTKVPAGIRIKGDTARITAVLDKLKAAAGPSADSLQVQTEGGVVAVGTDKDHLAALLGHGDLGGSDAFTAVVPHADRATNVVFVDFDAGGGWAERLADLLSDGDAKARANVAPLDALGVSGWQDGGVQHGLLRLTTD